MLLLIIQRSAQRRCRFRTLQPTASAGSRKSTFRYFQLQGHDGPVIAATDYIRRNADRIRAYVPNVYHVLGTDGFCRSDSRANLRRFFEVDRYNVAVAALNALSELGKVSKVTVQLAIGTYGIKADSAPSLQR